jgi:hypothetical protein
MSEEVQQNVLKIELGFDEEAARVIERMKSEARVESLEQLVSNALRVYDWYIENHKHGLYTKREETWVKVDLQL